MYWHQNVHLSYEHINYIYNYIQNIELIELIVWMYNFFVCVWGGGGNCVTTQL